MMTAVVIIITLMLSGCGKQLSMQDYYDQLGANFKEYVAATKDFSSIQTNVTTAAQAEQEKSKAQELCKKAETVLDKFAKMQPPSKYSEKHNELIKSIELEKKFWESSAKIFTAKTDSEIYNILATPRRFLTARLRKNNSRRCTRICICL